MRLWRMITAVVLGIFLSAGLVYGAIYLYAPVQLPDGVILKNMKAMVVDSCLLEWVDVSLYRINMYTQAKETIFHVDSSARATSLDIRALVDSTVSPPSLRLVNNGVCQYYIRAISGGSDRRLYGVAIEYQ